MGNGKIQRVYWTASKLKIDCAPDQNGAVINECNDHLGCVETSLCTDQRRQRCKNARRYWGTETCMACEPKSIHEIAVIMGWKPDDLADLDNAKKAAAKKEIQRILRGIFDQCRPVRLTVEEVGDVQT